MEQAPTHELISPEAFKIPRLVLESGARGEQLEAPHRNGIEDAKPLAPLRPGEGSGAEARGILEEEDLGRDLSAELGTSSVGGLVVAVKAAPPASSGGGYARTGARTWGPSFSTMDSERRSSRIESGARWLRRYTSGYLSASESATDTDDGTRPPKQRSMKTPKSVKIEHRSPSYELRRTTESRSAGRSPEKLRPGKTDSIDRTRRSTKEFGTAEPRGRSGNKKHRALRSSTSRRKKSDSEDSSDEENNRRHRSPSSSGGHSGTAPEYVSIHRRHHIKPRTFDGTTSFETFWAHFDSCSEYNGWKEVDKLAYLKAALIGDAGQVLWDSDPKDTSTMENLSALLRSRFSGSRQSDRHRMELRLRRRRSGETLSALHQDIRRLIVLAHPTFASEARDVMACDYFVDALDDPDLALKVRERAPKSLDEALQVALRLEAWTKDARRKSSEMECRMKSRARGAGGSSEIGAGSSEFEDRMANIIEKGLSKCLAELRNSGQA